MRNSPLKGIGLLVLALLFLWLPYHLKQPGIANHKILIATDKMRGGPFDKAVILVLEHNGYSATGLVLNKPPLKPGEPYMGGPVEPNVHYTLHSLDLSGKETTQIAPLNIGYTKGDTFLLLIGRMGDKPQEHVTFRGYTGWELGQLQREIDAGAWKVVYPSDALIFHTQPDEMWAAAMKLREVK